MITESIAHGKRSSFLVSYYQLVSSTPTKSYWSYSSFMLKLTILLCDVIPPDDDALFPLQSARGRKGLDSTLGHSDRQSILSLSRYYKFML